MNLRALLLGTFWLTLATQGCKSATIATNPKGTESDSAVATTRPNDQDSGAERKDGSLLLTVPDVPPFDAAPQGCQSGPNDDFDKDGYTVAQGDCNDCDPNTNPGAYDVPDNGFDEDCSGKADDEPAQCDSGPASAANDPLEAARSLGLCRKATEDGPGKTKTWGVFSAQWVFPDGTSSSAFAPVSVGDASYSLKCASGGGGIGKGPHPRSRSTLTDFGANVSPRSGSTMVALSSGIAQAPKTDGSPAAGAMCTRTKTPPGFPVSSKAACPNQHIAPDDYANDGMALELQIRVPTNAHGFSFDFDFYTAEFPSYVCSEYNDFFIALLESKDPSVPADKNISFDKQGNPVCVNNAFVEVCTAQKAGGKQFDCPLGRKELQGTGFDSWDTGAATSWLRTNAKVVPGETIKLRFAIWDMGDEVLDSTVLLDNFLWVLDPGKAIVQTDRPPTIF
jgi:hypothetical protein